MSADSDLGGSVRGTRRNEQPALADILASSTRGKGGAKARKELLTDDVAEMTGIALQTFAKWRSRGKGPAWFKLGRLIRYDKSAFDEWLNRMRAGDPA